MNKKYILPIILSLLVIGLGSAALLNYFGTKTTIINVEQAVILSDCSETMEASGGETVTSSECVILSQTSVDVPIVISTSIEPNDGGIESVKSEYNLYAVGTNPREDRIRVNAEDIGINTLSDLNTISFKQNVIEGYVGHVDVRVIKDDGSEDALVFEYDKVDDGCGNGAPFPVGKMDTFGDKGIVDNDAFAWLSSGAAGNCQGDPDYTVGALGDWKAGTVIPGISGSSKVVAIEFEVDSWIATSSSKISELKINDVDASKITIQSSKEIAFDLIMKFANGAVGNYTLTTNVEVQ